MQHQSAQRALMELSHAMRDAIASPSVHPRNPAARVQQLEGLVRRWAKTAEAGASENGLAMPTDADNETMSADADNEDAEAMQ